MTNVTAKSLRDVDVTVIVDRSGSMFTTVADGRTRWNAAREGTIALATKASKYDPDGITVLTFANRSDPVVENATADRVRQVFDEREPNGSTALHLALQDSFRSFFARKTSGKQKPNGELFLVITDGEPDNREAVKQEIVQATQKLDTDGELGILFVQIGNDLDARSWLKSLDNDLKGAKFDIVNTLTLDEVGDLSLDQVLASAFED